MDSQTPFIHLLRSPYHYYFYDVNTDDVVTVTEETYKFLHDLLKDPHNHNTNHSIATSEECTRLRNAGYLKSKRPATIDNPQIDSIEHLLAHGIQKMTLQVTQKCNFRCTYCEFTEGIKNRLHSPKTMCWEVAKKAIDFLAARIRDSKVVDIGFYGGEPLLEFDLITRVINYVEKELEGKKYSFSLTTNGSLLSLEIAKYLFQKDVNVMISLDGPKEIHDRNRVFAADGTGTYDTILQNIESIRLEMPEFYCKLSINSVIDPINDYKCTKDYFCNSYPHKSVSTPIMTPQPGTKLIFSDEFIDIYNNERLLGHLYLQNVVSREDIGALSENFAASLKLIMKEYQKRSELPNRIGHGGPCLPGVMRLFVDTTGTLFPCERVSESSEAMKIGHIDRGFLLEKVIALLNICKLTEEKCKECWALTHCKTCSKNADDGKGLSGQIVCQNCSSIIESVEADLLNIIALNETKPALSKY